MINNKGLWWLPEKSELKLSGELNYTSGEAAVLSLNGLFEKVDLTFLPIPEKLYETILGEVNNEKFTLVGCKQISYNIIQSGQGDSSSSKFTPILICKGFHFLKKNELEFSKIIVRFSHLREWFPDVTEDNPELRNFIETNYLRGFTETSLITRISPNLIVEIPGFRQKEKVKLYYSNDEPIVQFSFPKEKIFVTHILDILDVFRNLLQIFINRKIEIQEIVAEEEYGRIQLIFPQLTHPSVKETVVNEPVKFRTFQENPEFYLSNWFNFCEKFKPTYQLFFKDNYELLADNTRFLLYAQAIEAFHQRCDGYNNKVFSKKMRNTLDEFTNFSEMTRLLFNQDISNHILRNFKQIVRKGLRQRMNDICDEYSSFLKNFIRDRNVFVKDFVDARNYYTHYNPESSDSEPSDRKMIVLGENSKFILLLIFFKQVGFKDSDIEEALFQYYSKRVTEVYTLE